MNTQELCQQLQTVIYREIPIARFMGVRILQYEPGMLVIAAALEPNINIHDTAFAGSLYSICAMSGWGLVTLEAQTHKAEAKVVVAKGDIKYIKPIQDDPILAHAKLTGDANDIFVQLATSHKARVEVVSSIMVGDALGVLFTGNYALLAPD